MPAATGLIVYTESLEQFSIPIRLQCVVSSSPKSLPLLPVRSGALFKSPQAPVEILRNLDSLGETAAVLKGASLQ